MVLVVVVAAGEELENEGLMRPKTNTKAKYGRPAWGDGIDGTNQELSVIIYQVPLFLCVEV